MSRVGFVDAADETFGVEILANPVSVLPGQIPINAQILEQLISFLHAVQLLLRVADPDHPGMAVVGLKTVGLNQVLGMRYSFLEVVVGIDHLLLAPAQQHHLRL